ncbi:MAG: adenylate kinase [Candidatus Methanoperedens sp.]|nr:MAG: adenylate kinase [Candidatus Methanoperedens sp.]
MIIALTGTPGTGKSTVCEFIKEHSLYRDKYRIIDLHKLIMDEKLYTGRDEIRDTCIADMERLKARVLELIKQTPDGMDTVMEGHISHYLPSDVIIVLRAAPVALRKRLGKRREYSFDKVKENSDAEALDVILVESVESSDRVFEINTTDMNLISVVKSVVEIIESLKKGNLPEEYLPGKINWLDQVEL